MFAIWRACERLGIRPPHVKDSWEDCTPEIQAHILAYDQRRAYDESKDSSALLKALMP